MTNDSNDPPGAPGKTGTPFGIPGAGNLHDVMDSMQKAWGFNSATPMTPTLDIEEIDRRLQDLNTISQWLSLNQNMLQSTIQTLQVQRATLAAIQSFGSAAQSKGDDEAVSPMDVMQAFTKMFSPPQDTGAASDESASPTDSAGHGAPPQASADPQQWWVMLQNQFAQVADAALNTQKAAAQAAASAKPTSRKASGNKATNAKATRKPAKPKSS